MRNALTALAIVVVLVGVWLLWPDGTDDDSVETSRNRTAGSDSDLVPSRESPDSPADAIAEERVARPTDVTGVVVDRITGLPIEGAVVALGLGRAATDTVIERTRSDAKGEFTLDTARGDNAGWTLTVRGSGYFSKEVEFASRPSPDHRWLIELDTGFEVTGRVVDGTGQSVSGGRLFVIRGLLPSMTREPPVRLAYHGGDREEYTIQGDGSFRVPIDARLCRLEAAVPEFAPGVSSQLSGPQRDPVIIVVEPGFTLRGTVVSAGTPVVGATVTVRPEVRTDREPDRQCRSYQTTWTDESAEQGAFSVSGLTSQVFVDVSHPEYVTERMPRIDVATPLTVELKPAQWLIGRVIDDAGPVANTHVGLMKKGPGFVGRGWAMTDTEGRFRSDPRLATETGVTIEAPGYVPLELTWEAGAGEKDVGDVHLVRGAVLAVRVIDDASQPVKGALIRVGPAGNPLSRWTQLAGLGHTDADGVAAVPCFGRDHEVQVEVDKPEFYVDRRVVTKKEIDAGELEITVELVPASRITGRFVTQGKELGGLRFELFELEVLRGDQFPRPVETGVSSADGRFATRVREGDRNFVICTADQETASTEIEVRDVAPGEARDVGDVEVSMGLTLAGSVLAEDGAPVANAFVECRRQGQRGRRGGVTTDEAGHFSLVGLQPGTYSIQLTADGFLPVDQRSISIVADVTPEPLQYELRRGVTIKGRVVDKDGHGIDRAMVSIASKSPRIQSRANTGPDGAYEITVEDAASLDVLVHATNYLNFFQTYTSAVQIPEVLTLSKGSGLRFLLRVPGEIPRSADLSLQYRGGTSSYGGQIEGDRVEYTGLQPGVYDYQFHAGRYSRVSGQLELGVDDIVEVEYSPDPIAPPVVVEVVDARGEPVGGAYVSRFERSGGGRSGSGVGSTDAEGRIEVDAVNQDHVDVSVSASRFAPNYVENAKDALRGGVLRVTLQPEAVAAVTVRNADGTPAVGVDVAARSRFRSSRTIRASDRTDSEGNARLLQLAGGTYILAVRRDGQSVAEAECEIADGEETVVEIAIPTRYPVGGIVLANGTPVSEGSVRGRGKTTRETWNVGADGRFAGEASEGDVTLTYHGSSLSIDFGNRTIREATEWTLDYQTFDVTVQVGVPDGVSLENVRVGFRSIDDQGHRATVTLKGTVATLHVPAGRYELRLSGLAPSLFARPRTIDVTESMSVDLVVEATTTIEASIVDASAQLTAALILADGKPRGVEITNASPLHMSWPRGSAGMGVLVDSDRPPLFFTVNEEGVVAPSELRFRPGGSLDVRWNGSTERFPRYRVEPIEPAHGPGAYWQHLWFIAGRAAAVLEPGSYRVTLLGEETPEPKVVVITAGEARTVEF